MRELALDVRGGPPRRAPWRRPSGFTLIDILLAILVMTVGFVGVQMTQMVGFRANALAREVAEATNLARARVDRLKQRYAAAAPTPLSISSFETVDSRGCLDPAGPQGAAVPGVTTTNSSFCNPLPIGTRYVRRWAIDTLGQIIVQVSWLGTDGEIHYAELYDAR